MYPAAHFHVQSPQIPQIRAFCHYYPCGGVFFLFFFPPSDSRRFLLHSISTPNPTSPPKIYNRIQQFWVFVPFVKDKTEQEQFPSDQLIPIIFFLFLLFWTAQMHVKEGKRTSPQKGSTNGVHSTQTLSWDSNIFDEWTSHAFNELFLFPHS